MDLFKVIRDGGATLTKGLDDAKHTEGYYVSNNTCEARRVIQTKGRIDSDGFIHPDLRHELYTAIFGMAMQVEDISILKEYVGIWVNKGKIYIDQTKHVDTLEEARKYIKVYRQKAAWDIKNKTEVK